MSLIKEIREDPVYKKFKSILDNARAKMDLERDHKETMALHASRTARSLRKGDRYSPHKLIDSNMQEMSVRSRLVEIRAKNGKALKPIREGMEAMRRHIATEYAEDLSDYRTEGQRKAFADRVMKAANEYLAQADDLVETIDLILKDIDQSSHSMRHSVELLKLLTESKGRTV